MRKVKGEFQLSIFGIHHLRDQIRGEVREFIHPKELVTPRPLLLEGNLPGFPGVKEPQLVVGGNNRTSPLT